ncbi:ABC transporter ATP-binding protein [Candidatus Poriferisodalis multihospitum]|uniref:ABC transporter ATP-binding protein n=1 Tax=Candidatus Poriferisodalis multihospitum TaxID=2983191 RepID=UPI00229BA98C|nr:ABC transporter ATP-binding protein [Candidatus Poriferisodalis multihospitum]MCY3584323.1 ABC transporter ATP-binding protein [Acidimicrobiaceae bacterium]MDE0677026.1 ABC transporter ATP-binding protein [Acidimicrobiaceae bacterium]
MSDASTPDLAGLDESPLLDIAELRTTFHTPVGPLVAVDGVEWSLRRGARMGVVGESGSGKSVMSRSIMRLLPKSRVTSTGTVTFDGIDMMSLGRRDLLEMWGPQLAMVFQDPLGSLNPVMKIGKQVGEGLRVHRDLSARAARSAALDLLEEVGIPEPHRRIDEYPHQLSGGMRQRIVIAIALACSPRLLIADEPTTALDVTVQAQILDLLEAQRAERNMSLVLITHDLGIVAGRTDEIIVMYAGRIVERAPTSTLFSDMRMPYTEALFRSIPKVTDDSHARLEIIGGQPPQMTDLQPGCKFAPRCKYAQDLCFAEEPALIEVPRAAPARSSITDSGDDGEPDPAAGVHLYRCFYPVGTPEAAEAFERNIASGRVSEAGVVINPT